MPDSKDPARVVIDEVPPLTPPEDRARPNDTLKTDVTLTMGELSFLDKPRNKPSVLRTCVFQFNPTELERSRAVHLTRTPTGNTLDTRRAGERNQTKRKFSRKIAPWDMTLNLRFDAGYYANGGAKPGGYKHKIDRIDQAIKFFEALVEPGPFESENEQAPNANETPPPPVVTFQYGKRSWQCVVKNLRIKELDYTHDLYPRRFEVTVALEAIETNEQNERGKVGANQ